MKGSKPLMPTDLAIGGHNPMSIEDGLFWCGFSKCHIKLARQ